MPTLKVRARVSASKGRYALVPRYEVVDAVFSGLRKFPDYVGMSLFFDEKERAGFKPSGVVEIEDTHLHRQHVVEGDLWAADEATAKACGVKFDPAFGNDEFVAKEIAENAAQPAPSAVAPTEPAPATEPAEPTPPAAA